MGKVNNFILLQNVTEMPSIKENGWWICTVSVCASCTYGREIKALAFHLGGSSLIPSIGGCWIWVFSPRTPVSDYIKATETRTNKRDLW